MGQTDRAHIDAFLEGKRIAFVGLSRHEHDFSRAVDAELRANGYEVVPVHPGVEEIGGRRAYARVSEIPEPVDGVLVMTQPAAVLEVIRDCVQAGKPRVWLHRGVGRGAVSADAVAYATQQGIELVVGECPMMFLPNAARVHRVHAFGKKLAGTYPVSGVSTLRAAPLSAASALALIVCDWLVYAGTMMMGFDAFAPGTAVGAVLAFLFVLGFERRARPAGALSPWAKGAAAAVVVGVPLPLLGSFVGVLALLWVALRGVRRRHAERPA